MTVLAESIGRDTARETSANSTLQVGDRVWLKWEFIRNKIVTEDWKIKKVNQKVSQYFLGRIAALPGTESTIIQRGEELPLAPTFHITDVRLMEESRQVGSLPDTEVKGEEHPDIIFQPGQKEFTLVGISRDRCIPAPRDPS